MCAIVRRRVLMAQQSARLITNRSTAAPQTRAGAKHHTQPSSAVSGYAISKELSNAGGSFWDGTIPSLPHHREVCAVYRSPAFMQAIISPHQDIEQVATEDDGAPPKHQVHRREEQYRSGFPEQVPRDEHSCD
jgi:hypothetical protein